MYAVIETGGKQFRVELGTTLEVDRLEAEPGATLTIDRVLLVADGDMAEIGRPTRRPRRRRRARRSGKGWPRPPLDRPKPTPRWPRSWQRRPQPRRSPPS